MLILGAVLQVLDVVISQHQFHIGLHVASAVRPIVEVVQIKVHFIDLVKSDCLGLDIHRVLLESYGADLWIGVLVVVLHIDEH